VKSHLHSLPKTPIQELGLAEYVWIGEDRLVHSKNQVIPVGRDTNDDPVPFPENWTVTVRSPQGEPTQRILRVAQYLPDPTRPQPSYVVLCELMDLHDKPVKSNFRAKLRQIAKDTGDRLETWWGFRQEYTAKGSSKDLMAFYEHHLGTCLDAGLLVHSASWDDPSLKKPWFKVGPRRIPNEIEEQRPVPLVIADHLVLGRFFLKRLARVHEVEVDFRGQCPVYFSTAETRELGSAKTQALAEHLKGLVGKLLWESEIQPGASAPDRGFIYLRDLGPSATADPYQVVAHLLSILHTHEVPA